MGCAPPHAYSFVHSMKAGGLALDDYILCRRGANSSIAIERHEGPHFEGVYPRAASCAPSILMTHDRLWQAAEWRQARRVFVLRHPVSRVWSFYNFIARWFVPFRAHPLSEILGGAVRDPNELNNLTVARTLDLECTPGNCNCRCIKRCEHCYFELFNGITRQLSTAPLPDDPRALTEQHFDEAVRALNSSDVGSLAEMFAAVREWPVLPAATLPGCRLRERNPTHYYYSSLSGETEAMIRAANVYDLRLWALFGATTLRDSTPVSSVT